MNHAGSIVHGQNVFQGSVGHYTMVNTVEVAEDVLGK
jgi:hypothetical protein